MKFLVILALVAVALAAPKKEDECETKCKLPDCKCSSTNVPNGLETSKIPQV